MSQEARDIRDSLLVIVLNRVCDAQTVELDSE